MRRRRPLVHLGSDGSLGYVLLLTVFVLNVVRHVAVLKLNNPAASRAHRTDDVPSVIGQRSIEIVFCLGHNFRPERTHSRCGWQAAQLPNWLLPYRGLEIKPIDTSIYGSCETRADSCVPLHKG